MNCPWCGVPLLYLGSGESADQRSDAVHVYECGADGRVYLARTGLTRRKPKGWMSP